MKWQQVALHNLCEITSSKRIYVSDYQSDGIPFYRGREISEKFNGNLDVSTELFISESKYLEIKEKFGIPQPGDLLLTSVGTLGNPYVVKEGEVFYFKDGNLTWFRNFKGLDSNYLYYWIVSPQGKAELKKCTIGSSQSAFTIVLLKDMHIALPPIPTQRRIANILSTYDNLIENNMRRIHILEKMAQTIYQEQFGKVGANTKSLPDGWEVTKIANAFEILGGSTPSTKIPEYWEGGDINWYSPSDLTANKAMFIRSSSKQINQKGLKNSSAKMFPPYCVMMTSRATIGVVSINTTEACTNQGFITCIPNERVSLYQIYFWILENFEKIDNVASGATYKEIGRGEFREFDFIVPDKKTKKKFEEIMSPIGKQIEVLLMKNANLRQTRDLLLPRLVSGEVEVSEMNDN